MTDKELNIAMAEVMGWHRGKLPGRGEYNWLRPDGKLGYFRAVWKPAENVAQAFEVAEKVGLFDDEDVHLCKMDGCWVTAQLDWKWDVYICYSEPFLTPALAICNAVLKRERGLT